MTRETFTFDFPTEFGGQTVSQLTLRRPSGRDLKNLADGKGTPTDRTFKVLADLAEADPDLFLEMDMADVAKMTSWLAGLVPQERPPT